MCCLIFEKADSTEPALVKRINVVVLRFLVLRKQHSCFGGHGVMYKISASLYLVNVVIVVFIIISLVCDVVQPFRDQPYCGHSEGFANHRQPRRRGKIINGVEANREAWPWQVRYKIFCMMLKKWRKKLENILHQRQFLELMPSQVWIWFALPNCNFFPLFFLAKVQKILVRAWQNFSAICKKSKDSPKICNYSNAEKGQWLHAIACSWNFIIPIATTLKVPYFVVWLLIST